MTYSVAEQEAINLCICLEAINNISNHVMFEIVDVQSLPVQSQVSFDTSIHKEMFLIRVLDFVSEKTSPRITGISGSCIQALNQVCESRSFEKNNSCLGLKAAVNDLEQWLSYKRTISLWLPTLDVEAKIDVSREEFLFITGNYSKHNISRLNGVSERISNLLSAQGHVFPIGQIPLVLEEFREHIQDNYFSYYGTWLAELINNVRWGIQEYLEPQFSESYTKILSEDNILYSYDYPPEIKSSVPRQWFWRLMNHIRSRPYHKKFTGAFYLKQESSLEWQK